MLIARVLIFFLCCYCVMEKENKAIILFAGLSNNYSVKHGSSYDINRTVNYSSVYVIRIRIGDVLTSEALGRENLLSLVNIGVKHTS